MKTQHDIKLGVSLYSYQDNYYFKRYDLEGCIAAAAGAGAEGIEVFPEMMMPEWPYISDRFVDHWHGLMTRYGVNPVCLDHFADRHMWKNKYLSDDELYERSVLYIKTAARLGCSHIRLMHDAIMGDAMRRMGLDYHLATLPIVEKLLPVAAEHNVILAMECHSPTSIDAACQLPYLESAERMGYQDFIGLQSDFGCYEYCLSEADLGQAVRSGANEKIMRHLRDSERNAYLAGRRSDKEKLRAELVQMGATELDLKFCARQLASDKPDSYQTLKEYASKLVYIHAKFYDIDQDGQVDNIDYPELFKALKDGGYHGYVCSEFEGNRRMNDAGWVDEIELVRKQHVLMRQCLDAKED